MEHPTSEQVAIAWLTHVLALPGIADDHRPKPLGDGTISWSATGFVEVSALSGTPDLYLPVRRPVMSLDCWGYDPATGKPPRTKTNRLADKIVTACNDGSNWRLPADLFPTGTNPAHVRVASCTEPRRAPSDLPTYAHYSLDLFLDWVEVP